MAAVVACVITYASTVRIDRIGTDFLKRPEDFPRALRDLQATRSALNPSTPRDTGVALLLVHTGRPAAAERSMTRAVAAEPQNALAWVTLTQIRVARGRLAAARASWARARRLDPHLPARLPGPA